MSENHGSPSFGGWFGGVVGPPLFPIDPLLVLVESRISSVFFIKIFFEG